MSSLRRIQSSRANGARSRGPVTPAGKAASAQNARTHQLTAATVVLTNEDAPAFEQMLATYSSHFAPQTPVEADLQQQEVDAKYEQIDPPTRLTLAYKSLTDNSKLLSNLSRYESRHRRAYEKAIARLENKNSKNEPSPISGHRLGQTGEGC